ncbi:unnamed protein product [Protopolystoma xenopodis]|uniref:Tubulin--tyrosine ligase-like protein 5 n=1 Tax=Protopolystoma xenopodis TaxID=117903 RepID=A0A3S5CFB7_9PLAT|nr:unnamed protein product [Protopolystoma xenopodis]
MGAFIRTTEENLFISDSQSLSENDEFEDVPYCDSSIKSHSAKLVKQDISKYNHSLKQHSRLATNKPWHPHNLRKIGPDSSWLMPIGRLPHIEAGIMWTGVYRRMPIMIFSAKSMITQSDSVRYLGEAFSMTYKLIRTDCKLLKRLLHSHGFQESSFVSAEYNILWSGCHLKPFQLRYLSFFHKVNHFPRSYELTRKDRLAKNIQKMQQLKGTRHFDLLPHSYILPAEFQDFCSYYSKDKGPYIVKPIASSRGRGIYLSSHPDQLPLDEPAIVSKYISNPLLIDGFKFDLRLYVAVTSYDPLCIYVYEEGLARFATVRYQNGAKFMNYQCMHLTNYSVNKRNQDFVQNDNADIEDFGNKWSLGALLRYLRDEHKDITGLMMRIEEIIIKAFISVEMPINAACNLIQGHKTNCYELYGFDIIVDDKLRPWLLEVSIVTLVYVILPI